MTSETDQTEVREMIQALFRLAQQRPWDGLINDDVAAVFGVMLFETRKCSDAFKWMPKPPGGRASIGWLAMQLGRGVFMSSSAKLSFVCARGVVYKWGRQLDMASQEIAMTSLPKCA